MRSPQASSTVGNSLAAVSKAASAGSISMSRTPAISSARAATRMPRALSIWRQTAPAKTRGAVARPEKWPLPRGSFAPP